jgi:hypothetical protein
MTPETDFDFYEEIDRVQKRLERKHDLWRENHV